MKLGLSTSRERRYVSHYPRASVALWLATALLALLFVLLFAVFDALLVDIGRLQASVVAAQASRVTVPPAEEIQALRASADRIAKIEEQLQAALARSQSGVPWPAVLQRISPVPPAEVELTNITQKEGIISIRGRVPNAPALEAYIARLRASSLFLDVRLDSATDDFAVTVQLKEYEQ